MLNLARPILSKKNSPAIEVESTKDSREKKNHSHCSLLEIRLTPRHMFKICKGI